MHVLLVSDIHAILEAFEAVLAAAPRVDAIWNLGDAVGYGPRPRECIDRLIDAGANPSLVGNHDLASLGRLDLATFNPVAAKAARWTADQLDPDHRAYLAGLPPQATASGYRLAHGSPRDPIWEYVIDAATARENFRAFSEAVCFVGHSHLALYATLGEDSALDLLPLADGQVLDLERGRWLINPGSVGQPRDRDPRAAYAVLDTDRRTLSAHRVAYDVTATRRRITDAGLPSALADRLAVGR